MIRCRAPLRRMVQSSASGRLGRRARLIGSGQRPTRALWPGGAGLHRIASPSPLLRIVWLSPLSQVAWLTRSLQTVWLGPLLRIV
jgi:hypothetical protein